eukprot:149885-Pleurochrysis_carterae.AAC.2
MRARRGAYACGTKSGVTVRAGSAYRTMMASLHARQQGHCFRASFKTLWIRDRTRVQVCAQHTREKRGLFYPATNICQYLVYAWPHLLDRSSCIRRFMKPIGRSGTDHRSGVYTPTGRRRRRARLLPMNFTRFEMRARAMGGVAAATAAVVASQSASARMYVGAAENTKTYIPRRSIKISSGATARR